MLTDITVSVASGVVVLQKVKQVLLEMADRVLCCRRDGAVEYGAQCSNRWRSVGTSVAGDGTVCVVLQEGIYVTDGKSVARISVI